MVEINNSDSCYVLDYRSPLTIIILPLGDHKAKFRVFDNKEDAETYQDLCTKIGGDEKVSQDVWDSIQRLENNSSKTGYIKLNIEVDRYRIYSGEQINNMLK